MRKHPWKQSGNVSSQRQRFEGLAKDFVSFANKDYDVEGLCKSIPGRLEKLVEGKGERLQH